jgi:1,2-dihydroxy-3-keto-5-methylthiopentene dioxygenase
MSVLAIYGENDTRPDVVLTHGEAIAEALEGIGVRFERWQADRALGDEAAQDEVIEAYREPVDRLMAKYGFKSVDVVSLGPDHPDKAALRQKFLSEHTHGDFEVRFFVDGKGLFYIHADGKVYGALCEKGDLVSVPADTPHWFDMGEHPRFKCIRLFTTPEGWVAQFSGSDIAGRFPSFDEFVGEHG